MASDIISIFLNFSSNAEQTLGSLNQKVDSLGSGLTSLGKAMAPISIASAAALGGATKLAVDFDKTIQSAKRSLNLTEGDVVEFTKEVQELQKSVNFQLTTTQLAELAAGAAKLGVARDEIGEFTKVITKLGVATSNMDKIEELSANAAKVRTAFGLGVGELEEWGAAVNRLEDSTAATSAELIDFTKRASGVAAVSGVNVNKLTAFGATLISAGEPARVASTAMNKFLTVMGGAENLAPKAAEALGELGYSTRDLAEAFDRDANGTMIEFLKRIRELDSISQKRVLGRIFGQEHIDTASKLVFQVDELEKNLKAASDSATNLTKLNTEFDAMSESVGGQITSIKNTLNELGVQLGSVLLPVIADMLKAIQPVVSNFTELAQTNPMIAQVAVGVLAIGAALAPVLITLGSLVSAISTIGGAVSMVTGVIVPFISASIPLLISGITAIGTGLWAALAPIAPLIAAIAAVAGAAYLIYKNWEPIKGFFAGVWDYSVQKTKFALDFYKQALGNAWNATNSSFDNITNKIGNAFIGVVNRIHNFGSQIASAFQGIISQAKYFGEMLIYNFTQGIQARVQSAINSVRSMTSQIRSFLPSSPAKQGALSDLDKTGSGLVSTFLGGIDEQAIRQKLNSIFSVDNTLGRGQTGSNSPTLAASGATGGGGGGGVNITLNYSPNVSGIKLASSDDVIRALEQDKRKLLTLIDDATRKINRRFY